jgi:nucleosome binding factor SPN SPT16 subunit
VEALETLQEWLTKCDVLFYLNPQPMNWTMIMNEIRNKPVKAFLNEGGWSFLGKEEDEQGDEDEDEEDSDGFEPSGSESESDFDEEDEDDDDDDDDEEEEESDEEEEAADWDELDEMAARKDKKRFGEQGNQKRMKK